MTTAKAAVPPERPGPPVNALGLWFDVPSDPSPVPPPVPPPAEGDVEALGAVVVGGGRGPR